MSEQKDPEPFSPKSAYEAVTEMFNALTKAKQRELLGSLNEALVVLGRMPDQLKEYKGKYSRAGI
jgi:hypothetical protein